MALIETNFIRPQEVYDRNTGESKVRYRSYDGNDRFIPVVDGEKGVPKTMVEVTHAELKAMRDGGKLTAGALYRITDYNCTTTQENTQSAGHQFDIVLLALSEDKLAEEGWAMMHENIYDVTFSDGVTKKCYFYYSPYVEGNNHYWSYVLVEINTLLGWQYIKDVENALDDFLDKSNKTINLSSTPITSELLNVPNLPYNYFQNSNLSAWKVWYCLDNDKSRFAWADDSVDEGTNLPIGRGVIYRLVDEWNNDCPYDFKNIQYIRKLTDGEYDADKGTDTWVYTFSYWYNDGVIDSSTEGQTFTDDGGDVAHICENTIKARNIGGIYELSNNVIYSAPDGEWYYGANCINIDGNSNINTILKSTNISLNYSNQTIIESNAMLLYGCFGTSFSDDATIYIGNKKVLTES